MNPIALIEAPAAARNAVLGALATDPVVPSGTAGTAVSRPMWRSASSVPVRLAVAAMLAITIAAVAAAPAPAAPLPADSTALLSGDTSLAAPFAAPVGFARIGPNSISADGRYAAFI
jgi:hypothetical protein